MSESLYIIDGHAQIYRAYYAVTGLTSPSGEPTNATFGFAGMLLKLFATRKPDYIVMALDAGAEKRIAMDANYKAQRKPMPEDMPLQIDRIVQIMEMAGIPVLKCAGQEADDVVATLVKKIRADESRRDTTIYMCSKDKDLDQLIDERTFLFDIQTGEQLDAAGLYAKKGYHPNQARDVLSLTGDTVDNIPGIPGVGPKTAAKWIQEFGSLDNLIANADKIKGKTGETFRANLHVLEQSRKLVELMFDLPCDLDWQAARAKPELLATLAPVFRELGFTRMLSQLEEFAKDHPLRSAGTTIEAPAAIPPSPVGDIPGGLFGQTSETPATSKDESATGPAATIDEARPEISAPVAILASDLKPVVGDYALVNTRETLEAMIKELRDDLAKPDAWLAVDTETDDLGAMCSNLCGISLSAREGRAFYVAVKGIGDCLDLAIVRDLLGPMLADATIQKIGQNLKYDINVLRVAGFMLNGVYLDTMVASYVLNSERLSHGMDALAADLLGLRPIPITDLIGKGAKQISFAQVPLDRAAGYSAEDADVTYRLGRALMAQMNQATPEMRDLLFKVEMPLVQVLADMEYAGVSINSDLLKNMSIDMGKKLVELKDKIITAAGKPFNIDSPKQLADILFNELKLPIIKKTKTGASTDIEVLEELADKHEVPAMIVEYRQLTKLKNTYLDALQECVNARTHRIHASFNQTVAATGRLSSSDPNLQNIPMRTEAGREIRRAFVPAAQDQVLVTADYSQIELRMLAHYCQDEALLAAFREDKDVHRVVAAEIFSVPERDVTSEQRGIAKTVNFGIIYGQTGFGLSRVLKIPQKQASDFIAAYKKRFPQIEKFGQQCIRDAATKGFVTTILGRRRAIPDINSSNPARRQFGQRAAMNSVIQGSAADLIKLAMVHLHAALAEKKDLGAKIIMQIHDELVLECPEKNAEATAQIVRHEMEHAMDLHVPLKVGLAWGRNWLEGK